MSTGLRPRTPLSAVKICLLHHSLCQVVFSGEAPGVVAIDFDEAATGAEQDYRPKLRIDAASEDQIIAIEFHHRLHGYT